MTPNPPPERRNNEASMSQRRSAPRLSPPAWLPHGSSWFQSGCTEMRPVCQRVGGYECAKIEGREAEAAC